MQLANFNDIRPGQGRRPSPAIDVASNSYCRGKVLKSFEELRIANIASVND